MKKLKKLRLDKKMTQFQLATAIGVTARTIRNWEAGMTEPNKAIKSFLISYLT